MSSLLKLLLAAVLAVGGCASDTSQREADAYTGAHALYLTQMWNNADVDQRFAACVLFYDDSHQMWLVTKEAVAADVGGELSFEDYTLFWTMACDKLTGGQG